MNEQPERVEQFQAEINSMKVKASGAENESRLLILGIVLAVAGLALAIVGGVQVGGAADALDQQSFLATGSFLGIALITSVSGSSGSCTSRVPTPIESSKRSIGQRTAPSRGSRVDE